MRGANGEHEVAVGTSVAIQRRAPVLVRSAWWDLCGVKLGRFLHRKHDTKIARGENLIYPETGGKAERTKPAIGRRFARRWRPSGFAWRRQTLRGLHGGFVRRGNDQQNGRERHRGGQSGAKRNRFAGGNPAET